MVLLQQSLKTIRAQSLISQVGTTSFHGARTEYLFFCCVVVSRVIFARRSCDSCHVSEHSYELSITSPPWKQDPRPHRNRPQFHFVAVLCLTCNFTTFVPLVLATSDSGTEKSSGTVPRPSKGEPETIGSNKIKPGPLGCQGEPGDGNPHPI